MLLYHKAHEYYVGKMHAEFLRIHASIGSFEHLVQHCISSIDTKSLEHLRADIQTLQTSAHSSMDELTRLAGANLDAGVALIHSQTALKHSKQEVLLLR